MYRILLFKILIFFFIHYNLNAYDFSFQNENNLLEIEFNEKDIKEIKFDFNIDGQRNFGIINYYNNEIDINYKDLRIDTFRASGAGGQHINTTDSAVRITHLKHNIVVQSQSERSQHRNRDTAMKMLKSRIYEIELDKKNEEKKKLEGNKKQIGWGNQIRSYVLHPYKMVKDLRTNYQPSNAENVLDGEIFDFLESNLIDV